jgi:transcriptional regulator with XRE-family HTH domain
MGTELTTGPAEAAARRGRAVLDQPGTRPRSRPLLRTLIGDVLRRTRLEQDRTLADVARAARVSMAYLSEVERGRKEASSEVLAAICDALRIELADLLAATGRDLTGNVTRRGQILRFPAPQADPAADAGPAATPDPATPDGQADPAMHFSRGGSPRAVISRPPEPVCLLAA